MASHPASPPAFSPNVVAGALTAFVTLAYASSFAQLIFGGMLEPYVGLALLAALVGSVVIMFTLSLRTSLFFSIGSPDANPSAIIAATLAIITAEVSASDGADSPHLLPTVLMFVFLSSVGCGLIIHGMGQRGWGRYVRYMPYPVVGGFLAGTGYLLLLGAYRMLTGARPGADALDRIGALHPLAFGTAFVVAVALFILTRRIRHYLVIPLVIVAAVVLFHAVRAGLGFDLTEARSMGLLLSPLQLGDWRHVGNFSYGEVRWDLVLLHARDFVAMTIVVAITTLLNTTSLEVATEREADADRELRALGTGNVVSGLAGGMVGVTSFNRSLLNIQAGANSPWAARVAALLVAAIMLLAPGLVGLLPKPVLTGLIAFLGLGLLATWIIDSRKRLLPIDHLIVIAILACIAVFGVVTGVTLGIIIACLSFIVSLSRSPTIKYAFTAENRRSNVERPAEHAAWLRSRGASLHGFVLQGVLFFGTAHHVLEQIRGTLAQTRFALLDFRLVHDVDGSATLVLAKLQTLCRDAGIQLIFTGLSPEVETVLRRNAFNLEKPALRRFADLDHGLEWCEDALIAESAGLAGLTTHFDGLMTADELKLLGEFFEGVELAAGASLAKQGDSSDAMFLVESGRVSVSLHLDGHDARKRLRTYGPGTVLGEMGLYTRAPRSADMIADTATRVLRLTVERVAALEAAHPALALKLHRHVVRTLAERLHAANDEVRLLL
ncbi:MAG: SulP family inorganic anion transporter [Rariglobus sp.]